MDGLLALDLWDTVIEVLRSTNNTVKPNHIGIGKTRARPNSKAKIPTDKRSNTHSSQDESQLYIFEDNEAQTFKPKEVFHETNGITFFVCSTL